jgi:hypothetical protein
VTCKFCKVDTLTERYVCSDEPDIMMWSTDVLEAIVRCKRYVKVRTKKQVPPPLDPVILPSGLYPGQIGPPPDHTDADPDDEEDRLAPELGSVADTTCYT